MSSDNFDVWLFAVDLVNYVFLKRGKLSPDAAFNSFPIFACKSFTDILKTAVQLIAESVRQDVDEEFAKFRLQYELRPDTYLKYGKKLAKERSSQRPDAENFLRFSVHMALLAHLFYNGGDRRAQVSAVFVISDDYQYGSVKFNTWEILNGVAEQIVCGTVAVDQRQQQHFQQQLVPRLDFFTSPDVETVEKSIACKEEVVSGSGRDTPMKTMKCSLLGNKDKSKFDAREATCSTRRRLNHRIREHALKSCLKPMPSLEESLESSMEELSISKTLYIKSVNEDEPLNSTAELELSWKLGKMGTIYPKRSPIDRQILRLSPISARSLRTFSPKINTSFS